MNAAEELKQVRQACKRRRRADADVRAAILTARGVGASLQSIADAAGISKQRVWQIERGS